MAKPEALRRIKAVMPRTRHRLAITWDRPGPLTVVDLSQVIQKGGVYSELQDEAKFARVRVNARKRAIEWPEPSDELGYPIIEIDADALFEMGYEQQEAEHLHKFATLFRAWSKLGLVR
jgi:hypothetical protein